MTKKTDDVTNRAVKMIDFVLFMSILVPIAIYLLYRFNFVTAQAMTYVWIPGYLLMLVVILLARIGVGKVTVSR